MRTNITGRTASAKKVPAKNDKHQLGRRYRGQFLRHSRIFNMCEEIGCEPYLAGNLGSGTISELAEWIEYITFDGVSPMADLRRKNGREKPWKLKYLGIGNENWGCGGSMRPEYYVDEYRRYQSFCKDFRAISCSRSPAAPTPTTTAGQRLL